MQKSEESWKSELNGQYLLNIWHSTHIRAEAAQNVNLFPFFDKQQMNETFKSMSWKILPYWISKTYFLLSCMLNNIGGGMVEHNTEEAIALYTEQSKVRIYTSLIVGISSNPNPYPENLPI